MSEALSYFTTMTAQLAVLFIIYSFLVGLVRRSATEEKLRRLLSGGSLRGYLAGLAGELIDLSWHERLTPPHTRRTVDETPLWALGIM